MKILQIIQQDQLRGAEVFTRDLVLSLYKNQLGLQLRVVILHGSVQGNLNFGETPVEKLGIEKSGSLVKLKGLKRLNQVVKRFVPDIIQANASDTLKYSVLGKMLFRWNCKIIFRNAAMTSDWVRGRFRYAFNKFLVDQTDFVISVSHKSLNDFLSFYQYNPKHIECIPVGAYFESPELPVELGQSGKAVILHLGAYKPEKNHEGLFAIFEQFATTIQGAELKCYGAGDPDSVRAYIPKSLKDRILLNKSTPDVNLVIRESTLLMLPSHTEGLPAVLCEATAQGRLSIAYNVGAIKELFPDDYPGIVESGDVAAAAGIAIELTKDTKTMQYWLK